MWRPTGARYLSRRSQRFPLRLTTPLYLDPSQPSMAFLYVQNPTGGVFEDDDHKIALDVRPGAQVHLTTQSAIQAVSRRQGLRPPARELWPWPRAPSPSTSPIR